MLPKINRIKKKKDFEIILKKGKSFKTNFFILKILPNNLEISRFAFIISQRVSKKAVIRNRIKRILSEIIESSIKEVKNGLDIVFIVLKGVEESNFIEIKKEIISVFKNNKII